MKNNCRYLFIMLAGAFYFECSYAQNCTYSTGTGNIVNGATVDLAITDCNDSATNVGIEVLSTGSNSINISNSGIYSWEYQSINLNSGLGSTTIGSVTNTGTLQSTKVDNPFSSGIFISGGANVTNVSAISNSGLIYSFGEDTNKNSGILLLGETSSLVGSITNSGQIAGARFGIWNEGRITALNRPGFQGGQLV